MSAIKLLVVILVLVLFQNSVPASAEQLADEIQPNAHAMDLDGTGQSHVWTGAGSKVITVDREVLLPQGEVLMDTRSGRTIRVPGRTIEVQPGTLVMVQYVNHVLRVYNLCESKSTSVNVFSKQNANSTRAISLSAGQCLEIAASENSTQPGEPLCQRLPYTIACRNVKTWSESKFRLSLAEFSLVSLASGSTVLQQMVRGRETNDKATATKLFKLQAALSLVTGNRGSYSERM
jgi:hypothetical protein